MKKGKILILGAGSIGSYLAAKFFHANYHVDVIGRKADRIGERLYINNKKFDFPLTSSEINVQLTYDFIFLTCKIFDLKKNLHNLKKRSPKSKIIILLQNCLYDISELERIYNQDLTSILVYDGFNLTDNKLKHTKGSGFLIGSDKHSENLLHLFKDSYIEIKTTDNILQHRIEKAIYNCAINIFSATYSKTVRELFADEKISERMQKILYESHEVLSQEMEISQDKEVMWDNLHRLASNLDHYASTYQDVRENKVTELAFLNGFIIDLGRKVGVATPLNIEAVDNFKKKYPNLY
ncbi:ketopantoate reductase family protein [Microbulbifer variabilis]|uniref:ketopantoate reductase family protein n=1 Tax=Microbulbifer variabilis TaxID=266805 RepID=UPI001CFDD5CB|nr:ketopantoate reductase C-terminal domain-containing protein [Microbulbifer variabilis]